MSFIDETYFVADLNIPNTDNAGTLERVTWYINKYEPEFLRKALGYPLFKAFTAGMEVDPPDERYTNLLDGAEYTNLRGFQEKWDGFIIEDEDDPTQNQSVIANYVYYWYVRMLATQSTGFGEVKQNAENAVNDSPNQKMARAWNVLSEWMRKFVEFMDANLDVYPEWTYEVKRKVCFEFQFMNPIF